MFVNSVILLSLATTSSLVSSFPTGAPSYSCRNMIPGHNNGTQSSPPPYGIQLSKTLLQPGERTRVSVSSTGDFPFLGFICAASVSDDIQNNSVGTMTHSVGFQERDLLKPITCSRSDPNSAMTHTSRREKFKVEFDWSPPMDAIPGQSFKMRCTVVQSFFRCWTGIKVDMVISQGMGNPPNNENNTINSDASIISLSGNDIISNKDFAVPQLPLNILPNSNDAFGFPSSTNLIPNPNPNPNQVLDSLSPNLNQVLDSLPPNLNQVLDSLPPALQDFEQRTPATGFDQLSNIRPQIISDSLVSDLIPLTQSSPNQLIMDLSASHQMRNTASIQRTKMDDLFIQDPRLNEIFLPTQDISLALLVELISMGVFDQLQTVDPAFINQNSNPDFDSNLVNQNRNINQMRRQFQQQQQQRQQFSQSAPLAFESRMSDGSSLSTNSQRTRPTNRVGSRSGPNSRGLFQSSNARPFNRSFSRIRQPRIRQRQRPQNSNSV